MEPSYEQKLLAAIATQEQAVAKLESQLQELQAVGGLLQELPRKLKHDVMVPLGRHAFFPGQLEHTNELVVHLGGEHYAEMTARNAQEVLQRRAGRLQQELQGSSQRLATLKTALGIARGGVGVPDEEGGGKLLEIRESVEESDAMLATVGGASHGSHDGDDTAAARDVGVVGQGDGAGSSGVDDATWDAWSAEMFARYEREEAEAEAAESAAAASAGPAARAGPAAGAGGGPAASVAAAALTGRLQQIPEGLEEAAERDSDRMTMPSQQQQPALAAQGPQPSSSGATASRSDASPGFKRGFLLGAPARAKNGAAAKASAAAASSAGTLAANAIPETSRAAGSIQHAGISSSRAQQQRQQQQTQLQQQQQKAEGALRAAEQAFSAQVVERPTGLVQQPRSAAVDSAQVAVQQSTPSGQEQQLEEQPQRRVSKFKQQRMAAGS